MENQRNHRNDQKKMDQAARYVKSDETHYPSQQQYDKQSQKHKISFQRIREALIAVPFPGTALNGPMETQPKRPFNSRIEMEIGQNPAISAYRYARIARRQFNC